MTKIVGGAPLKWTDLEIMSLEKTNTDFAPIIVPFIETGLLQLHLLPKAISKEKTKRILTSLVLPKVVQLDQESNAKSHLFSKASNTGAALWTWLTPVKPGALQKWTIKAIISQALTPMDSVQVLVLNTNKKKLLTMLQSLARGLVKNVGLLFNALPSFQLNKN